LPGSCRGLDGCRCLGGDVALATAVGYDLSTMRYPLRKFDTVHLVFTELAVQRFLYPSIRQTHAEIVSQWNSIQGQDFFQRSPKDVCQRI